MKSRFILLTIMIVLLGIGMQQTVAQTLDPPTNLTYTVADDNDVTLFWDPPSSGTPEWMHWDDGVNADAFGFPLTGETWEAAAKWDPSHLTNYDGWNINQVRFYVTSGSMDLTLKIYTGSAPTLEYTEVISSWGVNAWTDYTLTTPFQIDASEELWVSLELAQWVGTMPMGTDDGPPIVDYGDLMYYNGTWYNSTMNGNNNWNLQAYVSPTKKASQMDLLGYNVYKDDVKINTSTVSVPTYVDNNLLNGIYNYYVTAVYDDGESDSSNHVNVLIDQPVILMSDSMALVDLYNSTDGPNWTFSTLWLEGPVNEWYGITTQGNRVTNVFLSNNSLNGEVLESFGTLDALETLHFATNDISTLPENFHHLSSLEVFWAGDNMLTELPDSFGYLPALYELSLGYSNINTLPGSFGNLSSLEWFGMYDGGLTGLPDNFGDLSSLETLFLGENDLPELPDGFGDLAAIRIIDFNGNELTSFPESFGNMSTLTSLSAVSNQLTTLPESFGNLSSLESLKLMQNQLESLSDNFGDLDGLSNLQLSINNITSFPASFPDLQNLQFLAADQNQLQSLPENIGDLPAIVIMGLSANELTSLPESIGELSTMTEIFAVDNQIESLPESIGDLDMIRRLAMGKNNISYVPETIGNLSTLLYIDLSENNLESIPSAIGDIAPDTVFLFQNQLKEIPESMFDNSFHFLWMEDNNLQFGSVEPFIGSVNDLIYAPQGMIGQDTVFNIPLGEPMEYTFEVSGEFNEYQWYKDGSILPGENTNTLNIESVEEADAGIYVLQVSNTLATELTLVSYNALINVTPVNIEEMNMNNLAIYPNPVKDGKLNIDYTGSETPDQITIVNAMGLIMARINPESGKFTANVSEYPVGLYFVIVTHRDVRISKKVLIL